MFLLSTSKLFRADLYSAHKYISENLEAPKAADNLIEEAMKIMDYIGETPYARPLVQERSLASLGIRSIKIKNYVLYFTVDEEKNTVNALRFLYNKRDWITILKEKT